MARWILKSRGNIRKCLSARGEEAHHRTVSRFARATLEMYGLRDADLISLRERPDRQLFRVVSASGESFFLRMYRQPSGSERALRSELLWHEALRREAGLSVPDPIPANDGSLTCYVSAADLPARPLRALARRLLGRYIDFEETSAHWLCALQRWVPGTHKRRSWTLSPADLSLVGSYIARLHNHAERYLPPEDFVRPRWDWEWVFGEEAPLWSRGRDYFSAGDMGVLRETAARVWRDLEALEDDSSVFVLIHRDLTPDNILFDEGRVCAVDFENCGWGYYLFDLAVVLMPLERYKKRRMRLQTALLEGYRRERSLPPNHRELLKTFTAMRTALRINSCLLSLGQETPPQGPLTAETILSNSVERLREFTAGG